MKVKEAGHLGGYLIGGDTDTWYPELWQWCVDQGVRSVLDVGCGEGLNEDLFTKAGAEWTGIEGVPQPYGPNIIRHDFTQGPLGLGIEFDLGWCCEVVEHVADVFMPNVIDVFRNCRVVMMTHAFPDQAGYHHVNCQPPNYWVGALAAVGFTLDERLTDLSREQAARSERVNNYYARGGLAFRNLHRDQGGLFVAR